MRWSLVVPVVFGVASCQPHEYKFLASSYAVDAFPVAVAAAHVDDDLNVDLVTGNSTGQSVSELIGDGRGHFQPASTTPIGSRVNWIGSLSGSPTQPIAIADDEGRITVLSPTQRDVYAVTSGVITAAVGDLNADGLADIVVASPGDPHLEILLGTPSGSLTMGQPLSTSMPADEVFVADVTGDGRSDVIAIETTPSGLTSIEVFAASTSGVFGNATATDSTIALAYASVADVDCDGKADLVAIASEQPILIVRAGDSSGSFAASKTMLGVGRDPSAVAVADLNHDKMPDLIVGSSFGELQVFFGACNNQFESSLPASVTTRVRAMIAADLNNDGVTDLAIADSALNTVVVLQTVH